MTFDDLGTSQSIGDARLLINEHALTRVSNDAGDELFQTPLLALTVLVVAHTAKTALATPDAVTLTLRTLIRHSEGLRSVQSKIQWSASLRRRCADALVFLEGAKLVEVREVPIRSVFLTSLGRALARSSLRSADELGVLARSLERAFRAVAQGARSV
jgi:hypothetical protein